MILRFYVFIPLYIYLRWEIFQIFKSNVSSFYARYHPPTSHSLSLICRERTCELLLACVVGVIMTDSCTADISTAATNMRHPVEQLPKADLDCCLENEEDELMDVETCGHTDSGENRTRSGKSDGVHPSRSPGLPPRLRPARGSAERPPEDPARLLFGPVDHGEVEQWIGDLMHLQHVQKAARPPPS